MTDESDIYQTLTRRTPSWQRDSRLDAAVEVVLGRDAIRYVGVEPVEFLARLPKSIRVSANIKTNVATVTSFTAETRYGAYQYPWISLDGPQHRNAMIIDIDHGDGLELALALPPALRPHLVVDPWSGRSAGIYPLDDPHYVGPGASPKSRAYWDAQAWRLSRYFRGSVLPHGSLTKNPLGLVEMLEGQQLRRTAQPTSPLWDAWREMRSEFLWLSYPGARHIDLYDVRAYFEPLEADGEAPPPQLRRPRWRGVPDQRGRNCELFDLLRWWAYDADERNGAAMAAKAAELNQVFLDPLPLSEVAGVARSVTKYMQQPHQPYENWNRGIMKLDKTGLELRDKQRLAALRTADLKAAQTQAKLQVIVRHWRPEDGRMTQAAVAQQAGVSLKTVKRAWSSLF